MEAIDIHHVPAISAKRRAEISQYSFWDVKLWDFKDPKNRQLIIDVLLHHPSSIVRHEVSFSIGKYGLSALLPYLMMVILNDTRTVAQHEAVEALDGMDEKYYREICDFLRRLLTHEEYARIIQHPDIRETITIVLERMESEIANGFA